MRKAIIYGFVLVCVTAVAFLTATPVERKIISSDRTITLAPAVKLTQVEVTNFPAVQAVSGTVSIDNLQVDSNGRLLVAPPTTPSVHFVGYSTATFPDGAGLLELSRACFAEFPGTRTCGALELALLIPPPPGPGSTGFLEGVSANLLGLDLPVSVCMSGGGVPHACGTGPFPVACCGF